MPEQEELQHGGSRIAKARGASRWWQKWELESKLASSPPFLFFAVFYCEEENNATVVFFYFSSCYKEDDNNTIVMSSSSFSIALQALEYDDKDRNCPLSLCCGVARAKK